MADIDERGAATAWLDDERGAVTAWLDATRPLLTEEKPDTREAIAARLTTVPILASDLVGIAEIATELKTGRTAVCNWSSRYADFPRPVRVLACGPVYLRSQILAWYEARGEQ